jgi:rhamnosyltransferase subunit B
MSDAADMPPVAPGKDLPELVVIALGSAGDVLPLAAVALALQARGRRVVVLCFHSQVDRLTALGLTAHGVLPAQVEERLLAEPGLWRPAQALDHLWPPVLAAAQACLVRLAGWVADGARPALLGGTLALGARLAAERWELPMVTAHVAPAWLFNPQPFPRLPGASWLVALPPAWRAPVWRAVERLLIDPRLMSGWRVLRRAWDLPGDPGPRLLSRQLCSPGRILGLFPEGWAGPSWSQRVRCTGFPLFDGQPDAADLSPSWTAWLDENRPVLGLAGSAMWHGQAWQRRLIEAAGRLGRPLLLLGPAPGLGPLPPHVRQADYLPLRTVLGRAAALVSHPGVGTTSLALAAGVPQLLVPWAFDHFDNAARLQACGVARVLSPRAGTAQLTRALQTLLQDDALRARCRAWAERLPPGPIAVAAAADAVEAAVWPTGI